MDLYKHLITSALHRNSECLRLILSRGVDANVTLANQFSPDALSDFIFKLDSLSACWYLIKPAVKSKTHRQAKHRLAILKRMLVPEIDRYALLEVLEDCLHKSKSTKSTRLLSSLKLTIQDEAESNYLDVQALSLLLQEESRCWRNLPSKSPDSNKKILPRFVRRYINCQVTGTRVLDTPRAVFPKKQDGEQKFNLSKLPLLREQTPQKLQSNWRKKSNGLWHQLLLVEQSLGEAGRERNWYLVRLQQCQSRGRLLALLESRLESSRSSDKPVKIPGKLLRQLHDAQNKLILRQVKLYDCIFGQRPKAYLAFISVICNQQDSALQQLPEKP
jgi:hypothetical protein